MGASENRRSEPVEPKELLYCTHGYRLWQARGVVWRDRNLVLVLVDEEAIERLKDVSSFVLPVITAVTVFR